MFPRIAQRPPSALDIAGLAVKHRLAAAMQLALARAIRHDQILPDTRRISRIEYLGTPALLGASRVQMKIHSPGTATVPD